VLRRPGPLPLRAVAKSCPHELLRDPALSWKKQKKRLRPVSPAGEMVLRNPARLLARGRARRCPLEAGVSLNAGRGVPPLLYVAGRPAASRTFRLNGLLRASRQMPRLLPPRLTAAARPPEAPNRPPFEPRRRGLWAFFPHNIGGQRPFRAIENGKTSRSLALLARNLLPPTTSAPNAQFPLAALRQAVAPTPRGRRRPR